MFLHSPYLPLADTVTPDVISVSDAVSGVARSAEVTTVAAACDATSPVATGSDDVTTVVADSSEVIDMVPVDANSDVMDPVTVGSCDERLSVSDSVKVKVMVTGVSFSVDVNSVA
jgi:hypothetical protein